MIPHVLVLAVFVVAVATALAIIGYIAWRGSKPSPFFLEAVDETYALALPDAEIDAYEDLKEKLRESYAPEVKDKWADAEAEPSENAWLQALPPEERQGLKHALMRRLVSCVYPLDQVQRDKPGNSKLWQKKLVSERYWQSLVDSEKIVSEEIDACIAEANILEPGWREHIFQQAVRIWRQQKQESAEKKEVIEAKVNEKKAAEKEVRRKEVEKKLEEEDKKKQERLAEKAAEKLLREEEEDRKKQERMAEKAMAQLLAGPSSASKKTAKSTAQPTAKAKGAKKK